MTPRDADAPLGGDVPTTGDQRSGVPVSTVVALIVVAGAAVFVVQNTRRVPVRWLVFDVRAPLWAVLVVAVVAGAVIGLAVAAGWRRRRARS